MSKIVTFLMVAVAGVATSAGGYYFFTRTDAVRVEPPSAPLTTATERDPQQRPKPNHGDFEKRFEPTPPPRDGGKLKQ